MQRWIEKLMREKQWKIFAIIGVSCFVASALLQSLLFELILLLVKFFLIGVGILFLGRAGYLAYPILKAKYEELIKENKSNDA